MGSLSKQRYDACFIPDRVHYKVREFLEGYHRSDEPDGHQYMTRKRLRRLRLLHLILVNLRPILRDAGGSGKFISSLLLSLRINGFRSSLGELVSRAARLAGTDARLYRRWARRTRDDPCAATASSPAIIVADAMIFEWAKAHYMALGIEIEWIVGDPTASTAEKRSQVWTVPTYSHKNLSSILAGIECKCLTILGEKSLVSGSWFSRTESAIERGASLVYSDHERVGPDDIALPMFKPDYSPELVGAPGYLPFVGVKREFLLHTLSNSTEPLQRASDLTDLVGRNAGAVSHISTIMGTSTYEVAKKHENASVSGGSRKPDANVSVIIPTRDQVSLLSSCVDSIRCRTQWDGDIEIVIVDNDSKEPETLAWFSQHEDDSTRIVAAPIAFNWSRLNNIGRNSCEGDVLVFLNNDVEVISSDWLSRIAGFAMECGVGAVGPLLLYPDDTIQHAGVVVGFGGYADHVYAGATIAEAKSSCFISPLETRNVSAVTGACLAISSAAFDELGGFDENLAVAGDIDLCLRALSMGYRNVYDGSARLYHLESRSRKRGLPYTDQIKLRERIDAVLPDGDPYYNCNLSLSSRFPLIDIF